MKKAVVPDSAGLTGNTFRGSMDAVSVTAGKLRKHCGFIYVNLNGGGIGSGNHCKKNSFAWYQKVIAASGKESD